jgi:hypothetical protein
MLLAVNRINPPEADKTRGNVLSKERAESILSYTKGFKRKLSESSTK